MLIKEERKKRRNKKVRLYIFLTVALLIAIAAFVVVKVFTVKKVVVEGNEWYSSKQIEAMLLNDEYSWNSLYVVLKYQFTDIGEVPFVDAMEVSLDDPHTVRIHVYEKGILGYLYIPILGQNAYFDKDGFVVETSADIISNVPKVTGVKCNEVVLYEKLQLEDEGIFRLLLNVTQTLKKYGLEPNEISFGENGDAVVYYGDIRVVIGNEENLSQKIIRLSEILPSLDGLVGTLHLENWTEESMDIVFTKEEIIEKEEESDTEETGKEPVEKPSEDAEATDEKPADEAEGTGEKPADKAEETGEKPADEAEETGEKPGDEEEKIDEKPADNAEGTGEKPGDEEEKINEKPADNAEGTGEKPAGEAEKTDEKLN